MGRIAEDVSLSLLRYENVRNRPSWWDQQRVKSFVGASNDGRKHITHELKNTLTAQQF